MLNIFDYEMIDVDLKENFSMQMDTECHQNDKLILHFIVRNFGKLVDLTNYSIELRVKKPDGTDYVQTEDFITKGTNGELTITCKDVLTNVSGIAKGQLRIWNSTYDKASGRILNINIIKDVLEVDRSLHESTLTQLEHLDKSINVASDYIKEADKIKNKLEQDITTGNSVDSKLKDTTQTANNTNKTLTDTNTTAINTKNELNTLNNNAINTKSNLEKTNNTALATNKTLSDTNTGANNTNNTLKLTISDADKSKSNLDTSKINADKSKIALDTSKSNADKSKTDLDGSVSTGTTLKNDIDSRIVAGNKLKTDIDNSSTIATTKKEQLDGANVQAEKNIETLNSFGDASQLTKDVTTLKTKVLENTLTSIETDNVLTKLDNCENGFVRNMHIRGRTLQNVIQPIKNITFKKIDSARALNIDLIKLNADYSFILDLGNVIGGTNTIHLQATYSDGTIEYPTFSGVVNNIANNITVKKVSFKKELSSLKLAINVANADDVSVTVNSLMVIEGEPKEIPPYFEGIKSTGELEGNKISILTKGKNLIETENIEQGTSTGVLGKTWSDSKMEATTRVRTNNLITVKPNTQYQLTQNSNFLFVVKEFDANGIGIKDVNWDTHRTFTTLPNTRYLALMIRKQDDSDIIPLEIEGKNIQIEEGTTATQYVSGKVDKTEILLPSPHCGLPSGVSDVVDYDKNERIKNVDKVVLNGSENWQISSNAPIQTITVPFTLMLSNSVNAWNPFDNMLSDKFINKNTWNVDEEGISISTGNQLNIRILKSKLETPDVAGFKKWLQANPTTVYYQLANPVIEKLTIKDTLQTFTNGYIQLDNVITPCTQLEYSTNIPSALGGLTQIADKLVDDVTNVEITISDMDAEIGEARKGKTTLNERLEEDKTNILNKFNEYGKKDGTLQRNLNAEKLGGFNSNSFGKLYINPNEKDISDANSREFYVTNVTDNSNAPNDSWHHVINLPHTYDDGFTSQIAVSYGVNNNIYFRAADGTKWLPWKELATTETKVLTLLNGWQNFQEGMYSKVNKTGDVINVQLHIKGGLVTSGNVICNTGYNLGSYNFFQAYDAQGNFIGMVSCDTNGNITITKNFTQNNDVYINIHTIV